MVILGLHFFHLNFIIILQCICISLCGDFDWDYIEFLAYFEEKWHYGNIDSTVLWTLYISPLLSSSQWCLAHFSIYRYYLLSNITLSIFIFFFNFWLLFTSLYNFFYVLSRFSHVWLFVTLWTVAHQAPLSMGFSRHRINTYKNYVYDKGGIIIS